MGHLFCTGQRVEWEDYGEGTVTAVFPDEGKVEVAFSETETLNVPAEVLKTI